MEKHGSIVIPIPKTAPSKQNRKKRKETENFRPIYLTSCMSKS